MEGVEDEDCHLDYFSEPPEVPPLQDAEATDPMGPDAGEFGRDSLSLAKPIELGSGGKAKPGARKVAVTWNYTHIECVAVAWDGPGASELGTTEMEGLYGRIRDLYLPKATELARTGAWTDNLSRASKKERLLRK